MRAIGIPAGVAMASLLLLALLSTGAAQDGTLDTSFGGDGKVTVDFGSGPWGEIAYDVAIQSDGKIVVVGGQQTGPGFHVARLTSSGALDTTFDGDGKVIVPMSEPFMEMAMEVAIQSDGKIVLAGGDNEVYMYVLRLNSDGSLDTTFGTGGTWSTANVNGMTARGLAIQADGKIVVVAGIGLDWMGTPGWLEIRLTSAGALDTTFSGDGRAYAEPQNGVDQHSAPRAVALQPDGKIVVAGWASDSDHEFAAVRLNSDGSKDTTFGPDAGSVNIDFDVVAAGDDHATAVAIQPDGKIVLGGTVEMPTATDFGAVRLTANGALDPTFKGDGTVIVPFDLGGNPGVDECTGIAVQTNGKIVLVGNVERTVSGQIDFGITRLTSDGNVDSFGLGYYAVVGFDLGGSNNDYPRAVTLQADGQIVVAGLANTAGTLDDFAVARLNASELFSDGFESGDTSAWSSAVP